MVLSVFLLLNLGGGELVLIVLVVLMLFGSDKLPELIKGLGKGMREINDAKNQIQNEILKSTRDVKEEFDKHTSGIQTELEKAGQSVKRNVGGVVDVINEEAKSVEGENPKKNEVENNGEHEKA